MKRSFRSLSWGLAGAFIATGTLALEATAAPNSEQLALSAHPRTWANLIDDLEGEKGHLKNDIVKLSVVLDKADRRTPHGAACGRDDHPKSGFCWNKGDNLNQEWIPQGLTASWDAYEKATYDGRTVVAASWYLKGKDEEKANRVTFSDRSKKTYDYIVLAKPTEDGKDIEPLRGVHSGGLAWVGRYLYVADTGRGLRVFDLEHIWRADTGSKDYKVANGKVSAGGYRYVLPQIGYYVSSKEGQACKDGAPPVHSSVAVDRKTKTLVTGEYCGGKGENLGRIVRWPLHSDNGELTGLLKSANDKVESRDWYRSHSSGMQGVVTHGDDVWLTVSLGKDRKGYWEKNSVAGLKTGDILPSVRGSRMCTQGPEDLTYRSGNSVWTLTEFFDERQVFPIQKASGKDCTPPA